jgi:hypothetical protein
MTPRRIDPLQRKDDMPDLIPQRQRVLREAETLQDMATRVLDTGGEPNYAGEKLARAFRANVHALLVLGWRRSALIEAIDKEAQCVPEAQL